jgi:hypothetical protein
VVHEVHSFIVLWCNLTLLHHEGSKCIEDS